MTVASIIGAIVMFVIQIVTDYRKGAPARKEEADAQAKHQATQHSRLLDTGLRQ